MQAQRLHDDFTRHSKLQDLGRWSITGFVGPVAALLPEGTSGLDAGAGECLVLKPRGRLYLTAPNARFEDQMPYDFFRYTSFGLDSLLKGAAFKENQITPFGGMFTRWAYELPRAMNFFPGTGLLSVRLSVRGLLLFPMRIICGFLVRVFQRVFLFLDRFDKQRDDPFGWAVVSVK